MAVTLPEGDLETRLERYLEGSRNRHGLEESGIEGNVVRVLVDTESLPAVLATAREALGYCTSHSSLSWTGRAPSS